MNVPKTGAGQHLIKAEPGTLIWSEPLDDGGQAVVKLYRRRPFYDPARRWFVRYRVEREYQLLAHMQRHGVPCPEPLWWAYRHDQTHGRHELLATREIPGALPLSDWLRGSSTAAAPDLAPVFRLARQLHECGVSHGAFYPTNVLVTLPPLRPPEFHVMDLAHGSIFRASIVGTRPAWFDLLDMLRAIERCCAITDGARWIDGYGLGESDTSALIKKLPRHSIERPWRHLRRAECDVRATWDRIIRAAANPMSAGKLQNPQHRQRR